jgi:copper ion binding protein
MKKLGMMMAAMMIAATGFAKDIKTAVFNTAPEMHCNSCENRIKEGLKFEKGVKDIKTDLETKTVTIEYDADKTNVENLVAAFAKINYKATEAGKAHGGCKKSAGEGGCKKAQANANGVDISKLSKVQFKADQIRCGGCARKVKKLMLGIEGVDSANVEMPAKVVTVYYDKAKTSPEAMKEAFKTINYTVEDIAPAKPAKAPLPAEPRGKSDKSVKFKAAQMHCGGCANKVKRLMYTIDGVCWVDVDLTTKVVTVDYQSAKTSPEAMKEAFKTINYTVEDVK